MNWLKSLFLIILFLIANSCIREFVIQDLEMPELMETPIHFPLMDFPDNNQFSLKKWTLGKKLFYDPIMSLDSTISCATCHDQSLAFSDDVAFSLGVEDALGTRNSPSLTNIGYHPYFTREGGLNTLEKQILVPIQEHNEFNFNIVPIYERMKRDEEYVSLSLDAFDREPDAFVITRAISTFERSLISGQSRYDRYSNGEQKLLNKEERKGMELFFSDKTNCSSCHNGFNFTNYAFENNGLYIEYPDIGRQRLTGKEEDLSLFKTASLRNIELTAPYMHDGSKPSLESVIEHYNQGGKDHVNKSELVRPLDLSNKEKKQLVAFLKTLTDENFINNPIFGNPN